MTGSDGMFGAQERKQAAAATLLGTELPGSQRRQISGTWSRIREMVVQVLGITYAAPYKYQPVQSPASPKTEKCASNIKHPTYAQKHACGRKVAMV